METSFVLSIVHNYTHYFPINFVHKFLHGAPTLECPYKLCPFISPFLFCPGLRNVPNKRTAIPYRYEGIILYQCRVTTVIDCHPTAPTTNRSPMRYNPSGQNSLHKANAQR